MGDLYNRARGEVLLQVDERHVRLCLTLGALAELEAAFDVISLNELGERLARVTAADLVVVIAALAKGGGEAISAKELCSARIDAKAAATAVAEAFRVALDE